MTVNPIYGTAEKEKEIVRTAIREMGDEAQRRGERAAQDGIPENGKRKDDDGRLKAVVHYKVVLWLEEEAEFLIIGT